MLRAYPSSWPLAVLAILACPAVTSAQFNAPPAPSAYALQGVTVVQADGASLQGVTVVIRGGRIGAIGPAVEVPADAKLLEGDSLFVYPGMVDGQGEADHEFPEIEFESGQIASWNPPRYVQGFMPHRRVVDHLTVTGDDLAAARQSGVVAAAIHPEGRLVPGRGTLLIFRADAETPSELVAQPELGPLMTFQGAQGAYPSVLFAVIAFYRQTFEDARHQAAQIRAYNRDPASVPAPAWDADLEVVRQMMGGGVPVFFAADFGRDIQRVLKLAAEYDLRPVIVGGEEAWKVADQLAAANVPVLVSLDFPEPERWEPESGEEEPEGEGAAGEDVDEEALDAAVLREKQRIEDIYANAGRLAAVGVRFALTSGGGKADMLDGARKTIEYGLSEPDALRALTATPASLFGIEHLTRIRAGMPATFVVTDGPLFAEETAIRYTFVEGVLEVAKKAGEAPAVDVTGTWDVTIEAEGESIPATMTVTQEGAAFEGSMATPFGDGSVEDGVVSGSDISFTIVFGVGGESMVVECTGEVEGDRASGSGDSPQGPFRWNARRTSGPGEEN